MYPLNQASDAVMHLNAFFWAEDERPRVPADVLISVPRTERTAKQAQSASDNADEEEDKKPNQPSQSGGKRSLKSSSIQ